MMLRSHREPAHIGVNVDCLQQTVDRFIWVGLVGERAMMKISLQKQCAANRHTGSLKTYFLVAVRCVHVVGGRVVSAARLGVQVGRLTEGRSGLAPFLSHLKHICRPLVTFYGLLDLV